MKTLIATLLLAFACLSGPISWAGDPDLLEPAALLRSLYNESQLLFLGESNHSNFQSLDYLLELIKEVGTDENLKYILDESIFEDRDRLHRASIGEISLQDYLPLRENQQFAYFYLKLLPLLREINKKRSPDNPLVLVPIDGFLHRKFPEYGGSLDREKGTQANFESIALPLLESGGKAIVFYHYIHLIQSFSGSLPQWNPVSQSVEPSPVGPINWLSLVFANHPEWRKQSKLVFFDEIEASWSPNGNFRILKDLSKKHPNQSFGFKTNSLDPSDLIEKGCEIFCIPPKRGVNSMILQTESQATLQDMTDALIWTSGLEDRKKDVRVLEDQLRF